MEKQREKEKVVPQISEECTFQPNTSKTNILNSEKTNLEPIYLRFKEEIRKKLERKAELRRRVEEEDNEKLAQFTVNEESEKILQQKENFNRNVVDRLMSYMRETEYKNRARQQEKEARLGEMTFTPEINPLTVALPGEDFLQRQQILAEESREKAAQKLKVLQKQCPFTPAVSVITDYLINIKRADESREDKIDRMHYEYPRIRQDNLERIEHEHYRECTFQPEIDPISRQVDAKHIHHCCDHPHEKQYPHKPRLNSNSLKIAASKSKKPANETIAESKTDRMKMEREYREMKECTFQPKTLQKVVRSETDVSKVGGFGSFMRHKEAKLRQEQEQRRVEERLFRMEKRYDLRAEKSTRVDEFRLSKTNRDPNSVFVEDQKRFQENCPFRPNQMK